MRAEASSCLCIAVAPLSDTVAIQTLWNLGVEDEEQLGLPIRHCYLSSGPQRPRIITGESLTTHGLEQRVPCQDLELMDLGRMC